MSLKTQHREIGRELDEPLSIHNVAALLADLRGEEALRREGRNSIILHKGQGLRVVLVAMRAGAKILSHVTEHPIAVQILEGSLMFNTDSGSSRLRQGQILTLHAGLRHDIEAIEETAFLLTLATEHPLEKK